MLIQDYVRGHPAAQTLGQATKVHAYRRESKYHLFRARTYQGPPF